MWSSKGLAKDPLVLKAEVAKANKGQHKLCHIVLQQLVSRLECEGNLEDHNGRGDDNLGAVLHTRQSAVALGDCSGSSYVK